jgi:hypothetical protein
LAVEDLLLSALARTRNVLEVGVSIRWQQRRLVAAVLCLASMAGACGGGGGAEEVEVGTDGLLRSLPSQFDRRSESVWYPTTATANYLFADAGGSVLAKMVDLRTGSESPVPAPPGDSELFQMLTLGLDDELLVAGLHCVGGESGSGRCPTRPATYSFAPESGEWSEIVLPPSIVNDKSGSLTNLDVSAGRPVLTVAMSDPASQIVLVLDGDSWRETSRGPAAPVGAPKSCATATHLYLLDLGADEAPDGLEGLPDANFRLAEVDLEDGGRRDVSLPELTTANSGARVELGCNGANVFLADAFSDGRAPALYRLGLDDAWATVPDAFGETSAIFGRTAKNGGAGPAFIAVDGGAEADSSATVVIRSDGVPVTVDNTFDCELIWLGQSGRLLVIGPFAHGREGDPASPDKAASVPIRVVEAA